MDLGIQGRTALVLGASGGLGSAVAQVLAREGTNVALAGTNATTLARTAQALGVHSVKSIQRIWDLANLSEIDAHLKYIQSELGSVDILFANTGGPPPSLAQNFDEKVWSAQFQSMVMSIMDITTHLLPGMRERKFGRIVISTSSGVVAPIPNLALSNALRAALVGWAKTLAREVAAEGITVNVVVPGRIETDRVHALDAAKAQRMGVSVQDVVAESLALIPMKRYGNTQEYAEVVAFLASQCASYITGSQFRVDGGLVASN
ncbi:MAG: SDR family oxidoreductase [Burkholderiales bacterium]|nr:SDR family oxidoreductase [Burkholderiales bacterium]